MRKQIYYHGTSADNLASILKYGLSPNEEKLWGCSRDEVYLWGAQELAVAENDEDNLEEWKERAARQRAIKSGRIACAVAKDCRVVVIKIQLSPSKVRPDESCDNMDGAVCIDKVTKAQILEIEVSNDISLIKGFIIAGLLNMWQWAKGCTKIELQIAEALKKVEWYPEYYDDMMEWETIMSKQTQYI